VPEWIELKSLLYNSLKKNEQGLESKSETLSNDQFINSDLPQQMQHSSANSSVGHKALSLFLF